MSERVADWVRRIHFPVGPKAALGFGAELWDSDPTHFEAWVPLQERSAALYGVAAGSGLLPELTSHLLDDVALAAGGVEQAILQLRAAHRGLVAHIADNALRAEHGIPLGVSHQSAVEAWYCFSNVLSWSRSLLERLERPPGDKNRFPNQGLVPALTHSGLRDQCMGLLDDLRAGPVGQSRHLANLILHSALLRHPFTGVELTLSGSIVLPIPDTPTMRVKHWYLLTWKAERDGFSLAEELWACVQKFMDLLLDAFEAAAPARLRK